jgi:hypothetical protein
MLQVVRGLVCRDTVALAKWIFNHATTGKVRGVALALRMENGSDRVVFTGAFKASPKSAVAAAARMYWVASKKADQVK